MKHSKPIDRINQLIQMGLGRDIHKVAYYRLVIIDPRTGFNNTIYREYAVEIMNSLLDYTLNDTMMYNRLRQLLLEQNQKSVAPPNRVATIKKLSRGAKR